MKKVLVLCEFSGIVRSAFEKKGFDAISCDLLPTERKGKHYQGDLKNIINKEKWSLIVAHPPCTFLTNSGVRWLYKKEKGISIKNEGRWKELRKAAKLFKFILSNKCQRIAIENPIPHKYAVDLIGKKYDQIVQPYMFGHKQSKQTCFWLKGLPKLEETDNVKAEMLKMDKKEYQKIFYCSPGPDRWKKRSVTFEGIAQAMADQWSKIIQ